MPIQIGATENSRPHAAMGPYRTLSQFLLLLLCLPSLNTASNGSSYNFLVFHAPTPMSHAKVLHVVTRELVARGHSVTTVRFEMEQPLGFKDLGKNHTEIVLYLNNSDGALKSVTKSERGYYLFNAKEHFQRGLEPIGPTDALPIIGRSFVQEFRQFTRTYCDSLLGNQTVIDLLHSQDFDAATMDLLYGECSLTLASTMDIPIVGFWASSPVAALLSRTAIGMNPTYIPYFVTGYSNRMSFLTRITNTYYYIIDHVMSIVAFRILESWIREKYLPDAVPISQLLANLSGMLINHNDIWEYHRPYPKTFINVLGMHMKKDPGPIPNDILHFIEGAEHGAIYFALGVSFIPANLPPEQVAAFFGAFERLPQRVIMRMDVPDYMKLPSNILARKFLPQESILKHPKIIVYFGHGGVNGLHEAIVNRKPIVAMGVWADGQDNIQRLRDKGVAIEVYKGDSADDIYKAVTTVRDDPSYKANVNKLADLLEMERHEPLDNAVWLMEYVAKTGGAEHMKCGSANLTYEQAMGLDLMAFAAFWVVATAMTIKLCRRSKPQIMKDKTD